MCKDYQGYTNYETWAISLWIDNDQGDYSYAQSLTDLILRQRSEDKARFILEESFKDWWEERNPLKDESSVFSDILITALSRVNWLEIADNWIENTKEESETELDLQD